MSFAAIVITLLLVLLIAEILSFKVVKKTTDQINKGLNKQFQQLVFIPEVVPPSYRGYYQTTYRWEMETPQKEVIKVVFTHDTGISKSQNKIVATLSMEPGADASLFNKVLPAVIADKQALGSAQDQEHANLQANDQIGYDKITLEPVANDKTKVSKITWEFQKDKLTKSEEALYRKLNNFPEPLLKILYSLQAFTIGIFAG